MAGLLNFTRAEKGVILFLVGGFLTGYAVKIYRERMQPLPVLAAEEYTGGSGALPGGIREAGGSSAVSAALPADGLDLNSASQADLVKIPGIGPVTADRIILYRESNGLFVTLDELKRVRGIGEKTFLKIAPYLKIN